jgi:tRNA (guanine-N7-)-methyltransferase
MAKDIIAKIIPVDPPEVSSPEEGLVNVTRHRPRMALTRNLRRPTAYVQMLNGEYSRWAFNEERAPLMKRKWREEFGVSFDHPLDIEIGTGNGYFFAHLANKNPGRALIGIERKFKPLIQSIRRAVRGGAENARIIRYDAVRLDDLFASAELNNVYIHHPDPWLKKRQWKHRLIQVEFLAELHRLMRPGSFVDFKTDSRDYFEWAVLLFKSSPFALVRETWDLHKTEWQSENFVTHFETIFMNKGQPIHYARLTKT